MRIECRINGLGEKCQRCHRPKGKCRMREVKGERKCVEWFTEGGKKLVMPKGYDGPLPKQETANRDLLSMGKRLAEGYSFHFGGVHHQW